jgi:hypothetical protein
VRRVVLILLTLLLVPSVASASWYRCAYDGKTRSVCCCPTKADPHQKKTPAQDASLRPACCCTVTHITSRALDGEARALPSIDSSPTALNAPPQIFAPQALIPCMALGRPRAQGDPPDTLFARRCSLLL